MPIWSVIVDMFKQEWAGCQFMHSILRFTSLSQIYLRNEYENVEHCFGISQLVRALELVVFVTELISADPIPLSS